MEVFDDVLLFITLFMYTVYVHCLCTLFMSTSTANSGKFFPSTSWSLLTPKSNMPIVNSACMHNCKHE